MKKPIIAGLILTFIGASTVLLMFSFRYGSYLDAIGGISLGLEDYDKADEQGGLIAVYHISDVLGKNELGRCYLHRGVMRNGMSCSYSDGYFLSVENLEESEVSLLIAGADTLRRRSNKMGGFSLRSINRIPESIMVLDSLNGELGSFILDSIHSQNVNAPLKQKYLQQWVHIWNQ